MILYFYCEGIFYNKSIDWKGNFVDSGCSALLVNNHFPIWQIKEYKREQSPVYAGLKYVSFYKCAGWNNPTLKKEAL